MGNSQIVLEMAEFVDSLGNWSVIAHHTFEWESSVDSARRNYERFMKKNLPNVGYFFAIEQNPGRDGHHIHALWEDDNAPRKATWKAWKAKYGRNRIEPCRSKADVVSYCSKYVTKGNSWWNFKLTAARFQRLKLEKSVLQTGGGGGGF